MKIVTIVGARPQFIKAALVSSELKKRGIHEIIVHTGQHYDENMSAIFFEQMGMQKPDYNLDIRAKTHGEMTGRMLIGIEEVLKETEPNLLLVYGDTNSTLAAALAARKLNIPIAHVEAGLRNHDLRIPEDVNRILTDRISDLLFCPTQTSIDNLYNEGFKSFHCEIIKTDDILADSVKVYSAMIDENPSLISEKFQSLNSNYLLCTVHRQESTNSTSLTHIVNALNAISKEVPIILPMHPRTKSICDSANLKFNKHITVIDPVGYIDMQYLLKKSIGVITDSGGVQKEAYLHSKYSLLLMSYTPWVELITNNVSVTSILEETEILGSYEHYKKLNGSFNQKLYGKGNARIEIVDAILTYLNKKKND
jgi:UDP-GlcNAc3NAcA epimerase